MLFDDGELRIGDERYMSVEDMESRFALVVGMCLSALANLNGIHLGIISVVLMG